MIAPALVAAADALNAVGVRAAVDPRNVNPPGAWVTATGFDPDIMCELEAGTVVADVYLVAPDLGTVAAHDALGVMLAPALTVVDAVGSIEITFLTLPGGGGPLPAYRIPTQMQIDGSN